MKRFVFRLQTLLKVRIMQEEEAQIKLSEATSKYIREMELEQKLENTMLKTISTFRENQQNKIEAGILLTYGNYINTLKEKITLQKQTVSLAYHYRQQCIQEMEEAVKKRKLVEKLKQTRYNQYLETSLQEEQKNLDELAIQVFGKEH